MQWNKKIYQLHINCHLHVFSLSVFIVSCCKYILVSLCSLSRLTVATSSFVWVHDRQVSWRIRPINEYLFNPIFLSYHACFIYKLIFKSYLILAFWSNTSHMYDICISWEFKYLEKKESFSKEVSSICSFSWSFYWF